MGWKRMSKAEENIGDSDNGYVLFKHLSRFHGGDAY